MIQLFLKYNYVVVTDKDCFWGVLNDHKTIIKPNVSGSFLKAQEFMSNQDIKIIGQVKDKVA
jgi:hypothetical protein